MEIEEGIKKLSLQPERAVVEAKVEEMIEEGAEEPEEKIADEATALVLPQKLRPRFYDAPRWVKLVCRYLLRACLVYYYPSHTSTGTRTSCEPLY